MFLVGNLIEPVLLFVFAMALGGAIAWGVMSSRARNRANDPVTEEATRELYRDPAGYDEKQSKFVQKTRRPK